MILVDTTVWADWFNGAENAHVAVLERAMGSREDLALSPIVLTEVLQGFRSDASFEAARRVLLALPLVALDARGHAEAAQLFRALRRRGVTIRGAADAIIAQTCIEAGAELLTRDRDFTFVAGHTPLRLRAV